jgi:CRISPR system Cascade subunit CasA
MDWVAELYQEELIGNILHLQVFGMCADKAKPEVWSIDNFSAPIEYITNKSLGDTLNIPINIAEKHQQIFRSFKGSPYHALDEALKHGDAGSLAKSLDGESRYWLTLDQQFTELLYALPEDQETLADGTIHYGKNELPKWTNTVQKAARDAFTESIQSIHNYEARAKALRTLNYHLKKLRGEEDETSNQSKKSRKKT